MKYLIITCYSFLFISFNTPSPKFYLHKSISEFNQYVPTNSPEFKNFVQAYFSAIYSGDTSYILKHTHFPIQNSDLGLLMTPPKPHLTLINESYFINYLQSLFPKPLIRKAIKMGKYDYVRNKTYENYVLTFERPLKDNEDLEESYIWMFSKVQGEFVFSLFKYDCN